MLKISWFEDLSWRSWSLSFIAFSVSEKQIMKLKMQTYVRMFLYGSVYILGYISCPLLIIIFVSNNFLKKCLILHIKRMHAIITHIDFVNHVFQLHSLKCPINYRFCNVHFLNWVQNDFKYNFLVNKKIFHCTYVHKNCVILISNDPLSRSILIMHQLLGTWL